MEEIIATLRQIQKDLDEQRSTIRENGIEVAKTVTENINTILDEKLCHLEQKYTNLTEQFEKQEKRLNYLEKQARSRNIVIFGMEENQHPYSYSDLEAEIIDFSSRNLQINLDRNEIQEIRKIGKKSEKPRPVVITLTTLGKKIEIFKQKKLLEDTNYYIKEDYPQHVLEKRRELQDQVRMEKEKGNKAIIKYDRLVIVNKTQTNNKPRSNKRSLSVSPQNSLNVHNDPPHGTQSNKKNKPTTTSINKQRTTGGSESVVKPGILNYFVNKNQSSQDKSTISQNQ